LEERPPGRFDGLSSQYAHGIITLHLETGLRSLHSCEGIEKG